MKNDVAEMKKDQQYYNQAINSLNYYIEVGQNKAEFNKTTAKKIGELLTKQNHFLVHNSRFEALKYSGKIDIVENKEIMFTLLNYYQEAIPRINLQKDQFYEGNKALIQTFRENSIYDSNSDLKFGEMVQLSMVKFQLIDFKNSININKDYPDIISKTEKLITNIEHELKDNF